MSRARGAVLVLSVLLATVGCAPEPVAPATSAPPVESPIVEPVADPDPVIVFDGDCAQMLTLEQRDSLLDVGSSTAAEQLLAWQPDRLVLPELHPITALGGLSCSWYPAEAADLPEGVEHLSVSVMPAAVVPREFAAKYSVALCEPNYDSVNCRLGRAAGDAWVLASAGWYPAEAPRDLLSAAIDTVAENLAAAPSPRAAVLTEDVWAVPDCVALLGDAGVADLIGPFGHGYWEGSEQPEEVLFAAAGTGRVCPIVSDSAQMDLETDVFYILTPSILPAAAWQWDRFRGELGEHATPLEVDGASDALVVNWGRGYPTVYATDGTNVVSLTIEDAELGAEILGRMVGVLSADR